jgi:hypothetical protein
MGRDIYSLIIYILLVKLNQEPEKYVIVKYLFSSTYCLWPFHFSAAHPPWYPHPSLGRSETGTAKESNLLIDILGIWSENKRRLRSRHTDSQRLVHGSRERYQFLDTLLWSEIQVQFIETHT